MPARRHLGQAVEIVVDGEDEHDERAVDVVDIATHEVQRTDVVSAVFKDRLTIGGADDLADADDTAFGPGDDGCVIDAAVAAVASTIEFLYPFPGVKASVGAVANLHALPQVHRARCRGLGRWILLVDVDGEGARCATGLVDGDPDVVGAALAEIDPDPFADELSDRVAAVFDGGAFVVEPEDVLGDDAGLGAAEGAVLAHANAVTPATAFEQDRGLAVLCRHLSRGGHDDARKKAQNQKSMESFPKHLSVPTGGPHRSFVI